MAICKIWSIKTNLPKVINYVTNNKKVDEKIYDDLHKELKYISNNSKTEEKLYISGINCDSSNANEEFRKTKKRFNKTGGIIAFHAVQSFKENEITPEEAHNIGIQLATEMWGDRFQVVVATHLNTNHLHNHFLINSISFLDGYRYYDTKTNYAKLRKLNNQICYEHNISYMEEKTTKSGINYFNFQLKEENENIYLKQTKKDVDLAIALANNYSDFINILENMNYEIYERANKLSIRYLDYKRSIRLERRFGEDYSIDNIKRQINGIYLPEKQNYYRHYFKKDSLIDNLFKMNCKGLAIQYIKYLKILNNYPYYIKTNRVSYSLQRDIRNMDRISKQTVLLAINNIKDEDDLISLYTKLKKELLNDKSNKVEIKDNLQLIKEIQRRIIIDDSQRENKKEVIRQ